MGLLDFFYLLSNSLNYFYNKETELTSFPLKEVPGILHLHCYNHLIFNYFVFDILHITDSNFILLNKITYLILFTGNRTVQCQDFKIGNKAGTSEHRCK